MKSKKSDRRRNNGAKSGHGTPNFGTRGQGLTAPTKLTELGLRNRRQYYQDYGERLVAALRTMGRE